MADGALFEFQHPRAQPPSVHERDGVYAPGMPKVVWSPLAGSQELVLSCPCNEILYEGTRGPGKTDTQLMKFRRYVGMGYGAFWRGVIFDKEYKNLDDLINKSMRWFPQFGDGARFLQSAADYRWVWPTGEELLFRQIKRLQDYWKFHGQEFPFIGWNELTKYATPDLYDQMKSCNRSSFVPKNFPIFLPGGGGTPQPSTQSIFLPEIPLITMATTNPYGPGHNWVKSRFIDPAEPGVVQRRKINVFNPRTQKREDIEKTTVRIFGSYKENKYLSPEYVAELEAMPDPNKRKAWLWGDWDIVSGGAVSDLWGPHLVLPRFKIPKGWHLDRSFDWGSSHPFSVGFWAESNGEEVTLADGTKRSFPRGTLIRFAEWYGTESLGTNKGLRLSAVTIAQQIKRIEEQLRKDGWIADKILPGPADNQIADVREKDVLSIKSKMAAEGIVWKDSDKSPGSRINGLQLLRDMMEASKKNEGAGIYFMDNCRAAIATVPTLPRDEKNPDDVDSDAEDHAYDEIRYRVLARKRRAIAGSLDIGG